uniref:Uncharacterized protein n=1 Tax=Rhizophora mucronata TaxID=61149 RepID=A0A2P2PEL3_RHIMU
MGLQMVTNSKIALVETLDATDFEVTFNFLNCHQLNEDARRNVLSHAQQIIWLLALKALYQLPKVSAIPPAPSHTL